MTKIYLVKIFFLTNYRGSAFYITPLSVTEKRVQHFTQGNFFLFFFLPKVAYLMDSKKKKKKQGLEWRDTMVSSKCNACRVEAGDTDFSMLRT